MNHYIAVDIGASSGRLMLGHMVDAKIELVEIHRFKNGFSKEGQYDVWAIDYLLHEILTGLTKVKKMGIGQCTLGMDTWAVDYSLLDKNDDKIHEVISYRDSRTDQAIQKMSEQISLEEIYQKTGIQFQPFNTLFQLSVESPEDLEKTDKILMVPDYLAFRLTGEKVLEKTNASTMQLVNVETGDLDNDLLHVLGLERHQFPEMVEPGTVIGQLQQEWYPEYDLPEVEVLAVASHDTASAVVGTPGMGENWAYLSSGTWSLLGVEREEAVITQEALASNYTNEGGAYGTVRFLKNIIGMWLIQEVCRNYDNAYTPAELVKLATEVEPFKFTIDVNDDRFLNPDNMIEAIQNYCQEQGGDIPQTPGEIARTIYDSLALCYKEELEKLSDLTDTELHELMIVGGGGNVSLLNQTIADISGIEVQIGPAEATALGNIVVQMVAKNELTDLKEARKVIKESYPLKKYFPNKQ